VGNGRRALIIGCGISGPVLAMFLRRAGIEPVIYEGRPEPDDRAGYFLNLAPNGVAVLDTLGIRDEVLRHGTPTTSIVMHNHRGKRLGELPETTVLIKRGQLTGALREAALRRGIAVEFGKRLSDLEVTRERKVAAHFEDGSEAEGDLLVGCDGIHSPTRRLVMPGAPEPRYAGLIDSGGFVHVPAVPPPSEGVMRMTFGKRGFFGYQVVPSGEVYWFENYGEPGEPDRAALQAVPHERWRERLLELHNDDHEPISRIIGSTREIGRWPSYDMPSLPSWHEGPVCLIGDAAHATLPSAGQGASMAMEDAVVLAKCLRDIPETEKAFTAFERLRKDRVEELVEAARKTSGGKAPANVLTRAIRDLVLPFFIKIGVRKAREAHSYRVEWDEEVEPAGAAARG
jgi:2-polyprenyl-6-methoxyphenol hydroxylase-like FAD-dependent oxidoreductase